jgi:flagellar hook assembly protein FlgD
MWQGGTVPDQVVAVVNWGSALLEERIDNNEGVWHSPTSSVGETPPATESTVRLRLEVFPNPFRSETTLRCSVPRRDAVELSIFDVAGRQVRILRTGETEAGTLETIWDGRDVAGRRVSAGVYLARLRTGNGERTDRLIMIH